MGSLCCKLCYKENSIDDMYEIDDESENITTINIQDIPIVLLISGPGGGKITIGKRLASKHGLTVLTLSEMLRMEAEADTPRGKLMRKAMTQGFNLPAEVVVKIIQKKMATFPESPGFLIIGLPRDKAQAKIFNKEVRQPDLLIHLWARKQVLEYNIRTRAVEHTRFDDTEEGIVGRITTFFNNCDEAVKVFKDVAVIIDGQRDIEDVFLSCSTAIEKMLLKRQQKQRENFILYN